MNGSIWAEPRWGLIQVSGTLPGVGDVEVVEEVMLVGSSHGGMVVAGADESPSGRIARLLNLDAILPEDGELVASLPSGAVEAALVIRRMPRTAPTIGRDAGRQMVAMGIGSRSKGDR